MNLRKYFSALNLNFADHAEEKEYRDVRVPVTQSFFTVTLLNFLSAYFDFKYIFPNDT